jgi:hypothetical protein
LSPRIVVRTLGVLLRRIHWSCQRRPAIESFKGEQRLAWSSPYEVRHGQSQNQNILFSPERSSRFRLQQSPFSQERSIVVFQRLLSWSACEGQWMIQSFSNNNLQYRQANLLYLFVDNGHVGCKKNTY